MAHSAFILGKNIIDYMLLAQELLRGYNKKSGAKRWARKIDIAKAYDRINLSFREYLNRKVKKCKDFKYHLGCKDLSLTQMCFADDLLVICHGDVKFVKGDVKKRSAKIARKEVYKPKRHKGLRKETLKVKWVHVLNSKVEAFGILIMIVMIAGAGKSF
nr:hypothetical protein [Tanacetum cinerariifolium]